MSRGAGFARFHRFLNQVGNQYISVIGWYGCFYSYYARCVSTSNRNVFIHNVFNDRGVLRLIVLHRRWVYAWGMAMSDAVRRDDSGAGVPPVLPSLVRQLGTGSNVSTKTAGRT